jgi:gliding motility-associated-like protein
VAQPVCSVNIGQDQTICQGQNVLLLGPPGYTNYLWSTGAVTQNITVSTPGDYWCQVSYPTGNMFLNGNFSNGNTGFNSAFIYSPDLYTEGNYNIGTNANTFHNQWQGVGNGNFLMLNAGFATAWSAIYCQDVTVCPGQTYNLSFRMASLATSGPPQVQWIVSDGTSTGQATATNIQGQWNTFNSTWTATTATTQLAFCLQLLSGWGIGNDIGLDDMVLSSTVILRDTVHVFVNPLPVMNCGTYGPVCVAGGNVALAGTPAGGTWSGTGVTGSAFNPATAGVGTHTLTYNYTDANTCSNSCTTNITVNAMPVLACGNYGPVCLSAPAVALAGAPAGGTWSGPGVSGSSFSPSLAGAGTHALTYAYTNVNGCTSTCTTNITVNALPVLACGSYGPFCINAPAATLSGLPAGGTWSGTGVSAGNFDPSAAGAGSHTLTYSYTDGNGCTNSCTSTVTVHPLPIMNCGTYGPVCIVAGPLPLAGAPAGGTWSGPGIAGNTFNPAFAGTGSHTLTYTFTDANGCSNNCTTNITVNALPVVACGTYGPVCISTPSVGLAGAPVGGAWSGPGVSGNTFIPANAGVGTFGVAYTYTDVNGCSNSCSTNITVNALPVMNCGSPGPYCVNSPASVLSGTPAGGTWSGTGVNAGSFDPSIAGVGQHNLTYSYTDGNGCSNSCTTPVTVDPLPVMNCGSYGPVCIASGAVGLSGSPAGGTWSGTGVSGNAFDPAAAGVGTHSVTYTYISASGCTNSCGTAITVNAMPVVACGSYGPICVNATSIPLAGVPSGGAWSGPGVNNGSFNPGNAGVGVHQLTYSYTDGNGCTSTCSTNITVNGLPVLNCGSYGPFCANAAPIALAGNPGGGTWSGPGVALGSFDPAAAGTGSHTLTYAYSNANGCSNTCTTSIIVNAVPTVNLGNDLTACPGDAVTFDATTPGATYLWQDGTTGPTLTTSVPGNYNVQVTVNGCSASDAVTLDYFNLTTVDLGADVNACAGTPVPLALNIAGASYAWSTGATAESINAASTGWYWVDVTMNSCAVRDSIYVTIVPLPTVNLGLDRMVCPGATALLDATTANATYLWNSGATAPSIQAGVGSWSVQVTVNGCTSTDQVNVGQWTPPSINLGPDTTLCPANTLLLDATTPFMSYSWQDGATSATYLVQQAGSYSVTLTDSHGCMGSDAVQVNYAAPIPVLLGNDTTICQGSTFVLDATTTGATYYQWNNGSTNPTLPVSGGGTYWVGVEQGDCIVFDTLNVLMAPSPAVFLGNDTTLCPAATLLLDASASGTTYSWQNNSASPTQLVSTAGTYWVQVTDPNLCVGTDSIVVAYADPNAVDLGPDTAICQGTTLTLDATLPGSTYLWSTGATGPTLSAGISGTYSVEVFQGACVVTDTITVQVQPMPLLDLGNDTTLCDGASITLNAVNAGATYLWSTGSTASSIAVTGPGLYEATVDLNGCTVTDAIQVTYVDALSLDLGNDTLLCPGIPITLQASIPGGTTVWSTNIVGPSITVIDDGIYWANISVDGCSVSDSILVQHVTLEPLDLGQDANLCVGNTLSFDITVAGASYLWEDGSTEPTRTIANGGTYWARIVLAGCETSDTLQLTDVPVPIVDLGNDTALCSTATIALNAFQPGASYMWNNSSTIASIVAGPGTWSVNVTLNGCSASDEVVIYELASPTIALPDDTTLCTGTNWLIDATQPGASYLWQDGSTQPSFLVNAAGNVTVTVVIGGCSVSDGTNVTYFDASVVDLGPDTTLCPGEELVLSLLLPGVDLTWSDGSHGSNFTITSAGQYSVLAEVNGCTATDAINVGFTPLPVPELGADQVLCDGDTALIMVPASNASVLWSTGSTSDSLQVTTSDLYTVTLMLDGCSSSDAVDITFLHRVDSIDLGPDASICLGGELELDATTFGASYEWNTGSNDPTLLVRNPGVYTVELTGPCINAADTIIIAEGNCAPLVYVPNGFTPNGDGINETFVPVVSGNVRSYTFMMFDRWGEMIFSSNTIGEAWDGAVNGTPSQDGVYVWRVEYKAVSDEGVTQERLTGHVTLLR